MKPIISWIVCLISICCIYGGCRDKSNECICLDSEVCIYDVTSGLNECYLNEWVHHLGGTTIIASNSYAGIIIGNNCIDTLIFINDTTRTYGQFLLYVSNPPVVQNVIGAQLPSQISENEYYTSTVAPLCHLNGENLYANLHFIINPDNVWMNIKFWTLDGNPSGIIDSCDVTFYRNK